MHFETHPKGSLHFWDSPSNARWFIHAEVHNEATRTRCPVQEQMQTSYDALSQENSKKRLEEWITDFSRGDTRDRHFLATKKDKQNEACPTYTKGGTWLSLLGHSITLCARATRAILNHAPIGEYRAQFHPQEPAACPCGEVDLKTRAHILTDCPRFTKDRVTLPHPCLGDLIKFLTSNPTAFAFTLLREPP